MGLKILIVEPEKCDGCRDCEKECSLFHFGVADPDLSFIRIKEDGHFGSFIPVVCVACEEAPCIDVCPMNARERRENGAVVTNQDRCIGCRACLYACPFGAVQINRETGKSGSCDLCREDREGPRCVKACAKQKALLYVSSTVVRRIRGEGSVETIKQVLRPQVKESLS